MMLLNKFDDEEDSRYAGYDDGDDDSYGNDFSNVCISDACLWLWRFSRVLRSVFVSMVHDLFFIMMIGGGEQDTYATYAQLETDIWLVQIKRYDN